MKDIALGCEDTHVSNGSIDLYLVQVGFPVPTGIPHLHTWLFNVDVQAFTQISVLGDWVRLSQK